MPENDGWEDVSHELNDSSDGWEDVSHELQPQESSVSQKLNTAGRSALEGMTMGLSEPYFSGSQALIQNTKKAFSESEGVGDFFDKATDWKSLKDEYKADVDRRRTDKSKDPMLSRTSELGGAVFPSPFNIGAKAYKGIESGIDTFKALQGDKYLAKIARGGATALGGGLGYESVKQIAERPSGFINEGTVNGDLGNAALWSLGLGAGIPAVFGAPSAIKSGAKTMMSTKLGVSPQNIDEYLKRPNEINAAPSIEELRDEVFDVVKGISDDFQNAKVSKKEAATSYNNVRDRLALQLQNEKLTAKEAFREAQKMVDATIARSRNEAATDMVSSLGKLKGDIGKGSGESYKILEGDKNAYSVRGAGKVLREMADEMNIQPVETGALSVAGSISKGAPATAQSAAVQNQLLELAQRLESTPEKIPAKELKKILQQLDESGKALYGQPGFDGRVSKAYKTVRGVIDDAVKSANPEYASKMKEVSDNSALFNEASEMFGTEPQALSTLNTVNGSLGGPKKELISKFQEKMGKDYLNHIAPTSQPNYLEMTKAQQSLDDMARPGYSDSKINERSLVSPEYSAMQKADEAFNSAEGKFQPFKSIAPNSAGQTTIQSKINTAMLGKNIENRRMFEDLSKVADKDFVKIIDDMRVKESFQRSNQNGSSNVNFWASVGAFAGSPMGVTGISGGAAMGAGIGKYLDKYGPRVAKQILNATISLNGKPSYKYIASLNLPPQVKEDLARDLSVLVNAKTPNPQQFPRAAEKPDENAQIKMKEQIEQRKLKQHVPVQEAQASFIQGN